MTTGDDLRTGDGRVLRVHDTGVGDALTLVWHHGTPQTGALLEPLVRAAAERGVRLISYGRPGYGGSDPLPGRDVASAAGDVATIADALGVGTFAVMGASGGGPHALACAALLPARVTGAVCLAGLAPYEPDEDWFAGMVAPGGLRAALRGRAARERYDEFDKDSFTDADRAALAGPWASLGRDAGLAGVEHPGGAVEDDLAYVHPWGFDLARIAVPVLLVQGGRDRIVPPAHAERLRRACPGAELWLRPDDGHISVLEACAPALDHLLARR